MSRMYWNSRDQMHFLGLEYCKKNFSKKSFRNLKKEHLISGYSAALWLDVTASAKLSWAAAICFCFANGDLLGHSPTDRNDTYRSDIFLVSLIKVQPLGHAYKLIWCIGQGRGSRQSEYQQAEGSARTQLNW